MGRLDRTELRGLWERESITYRDGHSDSSKVILWMQARSLYADIRIPRDLTPLPADLCLDDLDRPGLMELSRCGGFAGAIRIQGSTCYWDRVIDWQPDTGVPDVADLEFEGADLIENGGACNGYQVWRRRTALGCHTVGVRLRDPEDGRSGFLVVAERHFVYVRGRSAELRPAASLSDVLNATAAAEHIRDLFDAEVSFGEVGVDSALLVTTSTLPWQVGRALGDLRSVSGAGDDVFVADQDHAGRTRTVAWKVTEFEADSAVPWPDPP